MRTYRESQATLLEALRMQQEHVNESFQDEELSHVHDTVCAVALANVCSHGLSTWALCAAEQDSSLSPEAAEYPARNEVSIGTLSTDEAA